MAKQTLKTAPNEQCVATFLDALSSEQKRKDAYTILGMMQDITQSEAVMWGKSIVGFGTYHYIYDSGREGDWFLAGFSPRKQNLTLYIMSGLAAHETTLATLGKYKTGKSCLYIKKLADIDLDVLKTLLAESVNHLKAKYAKQ